MAQPPPANARSKYSSVNLNQSYGKSQSQSQSSAPRTLGQRGSGGMLVMGKAKTSGGKLVIPKPVNLPSLKKEHAGNDPTVNLVGSSSGSLGWLKQQEEQRLAAESLPARPASAGDALDQPRKPLEESDTPARIGAYVPPRNLGFSNGFPSPRPVILREEFPTLSALAFKEEQEKRKREEQTRVRQQQQAEQAKKQKEAQKQQQEGPHKPLSFAGDGVGDDQQPLKPQTAPAKLPSPEEKPEDSGIKLQPEAVDKTPPKPKPASKKSNFSWADDERDTPPPLPPSFATKPEDERPWSGPARGGFDSRLGPGFRGPPPPSEREGRPGFGGPVPERRPVVPRFDSSFGPPDRGPSDRFERDLPGRFDPPARFDPRAPPPRGPPVWGNRGPVAPPGRFDGGPAPERFDQRGPTPRPDVRWGPQRGPPGPPGPPDRFDRGVPPPDRFARFERGPPPQERQPDRFERFGADKGPDRWRSASRDDDFGPRRDLPGAPQSASPPSQEAAPLVKRAGPNFASGPRPFQDRSLEDYGRMAVPKMGPQHEAQGEKKKAEEFRDPVREAFEAELERVYQQQEEERKRKEDGKLALIEAAKKEQEEAERKVREEEERVGQEKREAEAAVKRAEQERLDGLKKLEDEKRKREEEKRAADEAERQRVENARKKLQELEERIARRELEQKQKEEENARKKVEEEEAKKRAEEEAKREEERQRVAEEKRAKDEAERKAREAAEQKQREEEQKRREEEDVRRREREPPLRPPPDQGFYDQMPRGMPNGPMPRGPLRADFRPPPPQGGKRDFSGSWRREGGDTVGPKHPGRGDMGLPYGVRPEGGPGGRGRGRGVEDRRPRGGGRGGMGVGPGRGPPPADRDWSWRAPESAGMPGQGFPAQEQKVANEKVVIKVTEAEGPSKETLSEKKAVGAEGTRAEAGVLTPPTDVSQQQKLEQPVRTEHAPQEHGARKQQPGAVSFTHPPKLDTQALPQLNFMAPQLSPSFPSPTLQFGLPQTPRTLNAASQQVSLAPEVLQALSKYSHHSDSQKLIEQVTQRQPKEQLPVEARQVATPEPSQEGLEKPPQQAAPPLPPPQNAWVARQAAALAAAAKERVPPVQETKPSRVPPGKDTHREVVNATSGQQPPRMAQNWQQGGVAETGGENAGGAGLLGPGDVAWGQRPAAATPGRGKGGAQAGNRGRSRGPAPGMGRGGAGDGTVIDGPSESPGRGRGPRGRGGPPLHQRQNHSEPSTQQRPPQVAGPTGWGQKSADSNGMPGATGWGDSQPQSILGQPPAGKRSAEEDLDIDELQSGVFGQQAGPEMVEARGGRRKEEKKERGKGPQGKAPASSDVRLDVRQSLRPGGQDAPSRKVPTSSTSATGESRPLVSRNPEEKQTAAQPTITFGAQSPTQVASSRTSEKETGFPMPHPEAVQKGPGAGLNVWGGAHSTLQAINLSQMQLDNAMRQHEYDNLPTTLGLEADPKHFSQGGPHLPIPIPLQGNNFTFGALSPAQLPPHPGTGPLLPPEAKKGIPGAAGGPFAKRNRGGEHVSEDDDGPEDKEAEAAASAIAAMAIGDSESEQEGRILSGGKKRQGSEGGADALPADLSVDAVEEGEGDVRQQQMPNGPQMMQQPGGPFAGHPGGGPQNFSPEALQAMAERGQMPGPGWAPHMHPQQFSMGMDSFFGPPPQGGFPGAFMNRPGQNHMMMYNHPFGPVGQFGQLGMGFMNPGYLPTGKQPDWKHTPPSEGAPGSGGQDSPPQHQQQRALSQGPPSSAPGSGQRNFAPGAVARPQGPFDGVHNPFQNLGPEPGPWAHMGRPPHSPQHPPHMQGAPFFNAMLQQQQFGEGGIPLPPHPLEGGMPPFADSQKPQGGGSSRSESVHSDPAAQFPDELGLGDWPTPNFPQQGGPPRQGGHQNKGPRGGGDADEQGGSRRGGVVRTVQRPRRSGGRGGRGGGNGAGGQEKGDGNANGGRERGPQQPGGPNPRQQNEQGGHRGGRGGPGRQNEQNRPVAGQGLPRGGASGPRRGGGRMGGGERPPAANGGVAPGGGNAAAREAAKVKQVYVAKQGGAAPLPRKEGPPGGRQQSV